MNVKAPTGSKMTCKTWAAEAAMRMLMNNLDKEVAENPRELIVYGGTGRAARSWKAFHSIVRALKSLEKDETLLVQSGKPVGIFKTFENSPRVLIANSNLVPAWANWDYFRDLEARGLIMYGQMTAGSWIYIGTQGILQGTYETFASVAKNHFKGNISGKLVVSGGLGGMSGAQPLAATMNGAVFLGVEVDKKRIEKRVKTGYCDIITENFEKAVSLVAKAKKEKTPLSIGLVGNIADILPKLLKRGIIPDILTDQTSAHDPLNGYVPNGISYEKALKLRKSNPKEYLKRAKNTIALHINAMLKLKRKGAITFEYGNNLRKQAVIAGVSKAFEIPGFVQEYIRPLFCYGKGPFRWVALSGRKQDIYETDKVILKEFSKDKLLCNWIRLAQKKVKFQGLPSRICWLGYGDREKFALLINRLVKRNVLKAPIVIGRDHLDCGSVASPYRETEGMKDGSDAIADWPLLNAMLNTASGASWVSIHHGGGVGIGYSIHAGQVVVADGSKDSEKRLSRVLTNDPGIGVARHVDAGYKTAVKVAKAKKIKIPFKNFSNAEFSKK